MGRQRKTKQKSKLNTWKFYCDRDLHNSNVTYSIRKIETYKYWKRQSEAQDAANILHAIWLIFFIVGLTALFLVACKVCYGIKRYLQEIEDWLQMTCKPMLDHWFTVELPIKWNTLITTIRNWPSKYCDNSNCWSITIPVYVYIFLCYVLILVLIFPE